MISSAVSKKLYVFHGIGVFFVILRHSKLPCMSSSMVVAADCISNYARLFWPLYMIIAGYLFYEGITVDHLFRNFTDKYKRRFVSVVIPFLIWDFLGVVLLLLLCYVGAEDEWSILASDIYTSRGVFGLFADCGTLQMWFIRDLLVCFFFALPLFFFLRICHPLISLLAILSLFLLPEWIGFYDFIVSPFSLAMFSIGGLLQLKGGTIEKYTLSPWGAWLLFVFMILLVFILTICNPGLSFYHFQWLSVFSFLSLWFLYDHMSYAFIFVEQTWSLGAHHFLIFATFEPMYSIIKHGVVRVLGLFYYDSLFCQFVLLCLLPFLMLYLTSGLAKCIECHIPKLYNMLSGYRNK